MAATDHTDPSGPPGGSQPLHGHAWSRRASMAGVPDDRRRRHEDEVREAHRNWYLEQGLPIPKELNA